MLYILTLLLISCGNVSGGAPSSNTRTSPTIPDLTNKYIENPQNIATKLMLENLVMHLYLPCQDMIVM